MKYLILIISLFLSNIVLAESSKKLEAWQIPYTKEWCNLANKVNSCDLCKDFKMQKEIGKYWLEMKAFWFQFQDAVKNDRKEILVEMMQYPLSIFYQPKPVSISLSSRDREILLKEMIINDKHEFIEKYELIFNPKFKKWIIEEPYYGLRVAKNNLTFNGYYSRVVISKDCDFTKVKREECPCMKVKYMINDEILMEEFSK